jgi:hypothetical protein
MSDLQLYFDGPFTFCDGPDSVFRSRLRASAGVYLWTIQQASDNTHLIHYVGETVQLGNRQREHLVQILGLNYGIFDPDKARRGVCELLWGGLWRDRTPDGPGRTLSEYQRLNEDIVRYVEAISIFFAELNVESRLRKHIEGCIGWNLRNNHPECKQLYPDDNHVGTMKVRESGRLLITAAGVIRGLDASIEY